MALTKTSTDGIKDDAVTQDKIAAGAVNTPEIATNAVNSDKLANNAVGGLQLQSLAVTANKIAAGEINNTHIGTGAINGDRLTDETVTLAKLPHGDGSSDGKFLRANNGADPTFETVNTDLVSDLTPQLGGALDSNEHCIDFGDSSGVNNDRLKFGDSDDLQIYHQSGTGYIDDLVGSGDGVTIRAKNIRFQSNANVGAKSAINCNQNAAIELFHNDVKQLETTENGIYLPKGAIRGLGSGTKVIIGGALNPNQDITWNFSFSTNHAGYNNGYVFNVKFVLNHWNVGGSYKYIESMTGGRGNVTGMERVDLINNVGTASSGWTNGHLDYSVSLSGGTINGSGASLFKVTYDADGAPSWTSGYFLEVSHSGQIGTISIT